MANIADNTIMTQPEIENAQIIWDYMTLDHCCEKSHVIFCLGSNDIRVAERAAELWLHGMADHIVFSGNSGHRKLTSGVWNKPEAEVFSDRAIAMGVSEDNIIIENLSTNTGENVRFTYDILKERDLLPKSLIIVQKPFMERRAYATFMKQWPGDTSGIRVFVTSPNVKMIDYPSETTGTLTDVVNVVVGDFARIKLYEEKGFQIHQCVPEKVQAAYDFLVATNKYTSHMPT